MTKKSKLAIFASGSGTNAENIIRFFKDSSEIDVARIYTNKPGAGVLFRAHKLNVPSVCFTQNHLKNGLVLEDLIKHEIDGVILAGFMQLIPSNLIEQYPNEILNIHPALLPKFGGKGMYGHHVHEAVVTSGEKESGITIHRVNEKYDEGEILLQEKVQVEEGETPESLARKIHELEYTHYPQVIQNIFG